MATERKRPTAADVVEEKIDQPETETEAADEATQEAPSAQVDDETGLEEADSGNAAGYARENIGPRVGMTDPKAIEEHEKELEEDDQVPLLFPRKVMLQDKGLMHTWEAGVHLVPAALAKHWYLKQHGVKRAGPVVKKA